MYVYSRCIILSSKAEGIRYSVSRVRKFQYSALLVVDKNDNTIDIVSILDS